MKGLGGVNHGLMELVVMLVMEKVLVVGWEDLGFGRWIWCRGFWWRRKWGSLNFEKSH